MNNLIWGIVGNVITSAVAMLIPRLFIVNYGSEINGFLSSIRQIYVYLALLETGVGTASEVALYGPVGREDHDSTNRILAATDQYYKKIGLLYAGCVVIAGILYPLLLDTTIPYRICRLIMILQGSGSVIGYLVQGKYNMLLRVDNRSYVITNLTTVTTVLTDLTRILLLLNGKSILAVQTTYLVFNLVKMVYVSWYIRRHYPWLDVSVKPDFQAISQRGAVFVHQISALVFSHTDVLLLTFLCGLKTVSIYSMYATVYGMVDNLIAITSNSVQSAFGQIYHTDRKKYMELYEAFETYYLALVFSLLAIATVFILPFMRLYTSGADINYIDWKLPVFFGIYQLLNYGRFPANMVIGFAGEFRTTQWRACLEAAINLVVSFICVFRFGIYGVLFGTIAALLYRANDMILFANHRVLQKSAFSSYRKWGGNIILFVLLAGGVLKLPLRFDSYGKMLMHAAWIGPFILLTFFLVNSLMEKNACKTAKKYLKSSIKMLLQREKYTHA